MSKDAKTRAVELFNEHLHLVQTNQKLFRKTILDTIIAEFTTPEKTFSVASAATHYNNAKKAAEAAGLVAGLGRVSIPGEKVPNADGTMPFDDCDCITVCEVCENVVRRTQSFINEELARKTYQERLKSRFQGTWKLIKGLGPNVGDTYKLADTELELA